MNAYMGVETRT